jgi:hypothetical protein
MHNKFLRMYEKMFIVENKTSGLKYCYYGWNDEVYVHFMFDVLRYLEPRRELPDTVIQE